MNRAERKMGTSTYRYINLNPKGLYRGDCVIRAMAAFTNKPWRSIYREMADIGVVEGLVLNDPLNCEKLLAKDGIIKQKMPRRADRTRYTVEEFCEELAEDGKVYLISLARHFTCIGPDHKIWDIWDCGEKSVGNYWERNISDLDKEYYNLRMQGGK